MGRWTLPVIAAFVTSGLGAAINFATDNARIWWLWVIVVALSIVAAALAIQHRQSAQPASSIQAKGTPPTGEQWKIRQQINLKTSGSTNIAGRDFTVNSSDEKPQPNG